MDVFPEENQEMSVATTKIEIATEMTMVIGETRKIRTMETITAKESQIGEKYRCCKYEKFSTGECSSNVFNFFQG